MILEVAERFPTILTGVNFGLRGGEVREERRAADLDDARIRGGLRWRGIARGDDLSVRGRSATSRGQQQGKKG
jgi:hypothetical protein